MRGIIISETKEVERIMKCEYSTDWGIGVGKVIMLMGKYYYSLGQNREEVYKNINLFLKEKMDKYTPKKWSELVNNVLDTIEKNGWYNLIDIDSISITKAEWETIIGIGNVKLEKIAFVLLCYIKVYKARGSNKDRMDNLSDLLSECGITPNKENKILLADLKDLELIQIGTLKHMFVKPLYINEESDIYINIDDFEKVVSYYDEYKNGSKYGKCKICGKRFKISKNGIGSYCTICKKDRNLQKSRRWKEKNRK